MNAYNLSFSKENLMNIFKDYSVQTNIVSVLCWINSPSEITIVLAVLNFIITFFTSIPKLILTGAKIYGFYEAWRKGKKIFQNASDEAKNENKDE